MTEVPSRLVAVGVHVGCLSIRVRRISTGTGNGGYGGGNSGVGTEPKGKNRTKINHINQMKVKAELFIIQSV